ncbi:FAD:protein FMN transferase [Hanstruepera neustonica]|uniref:FAD:protein FMN transferase n=1 Tax=Hanstruepera neustonica TaxID=1445657 RepID=A0A2K1E4U0_9FLAO|nr:FAD:protein FMN transferase [Hanstruepera neustonica]PNQ75298.1 FAD:protein FMN transferase [Hanstruepera neustonica]
MQHPIFKTFAFLIIILSVVSCKTDKKFQNTKLSGAVFGTSYSAIYDVETDFSEQFDSIFKVINKSMSTYQKDSDISKWNRNESNEIDAHFIEVYNASKRIYEQTNGVFDPTIGTIVNALGFGPEEKMNELDSLKVDSLMQFVGFDKLFLADRFLIKKHKSTYMDFNAIAKGYGVDVIANFLESKNSDNYLVEIGGEIRSKGKNLEKDAPWKVGIDNPNFDGSQSVIKAITLTDDAMATSGTYRKFKVDENGNRYAHIIDAKTGYPSKTNILSVSVLAPNCMTADGFATAFQAMGIEKIDEFLKTHPELKVFIIYESDNGDLMTQAFNGFPES